VIQLLEALVASDSKALDAASLAIAWNLLGTSYRDIDELDKARRCYEASIHILDTLPGQRSEYASALDNLGGVEELSGQLDMAKTLRIRAKHIYEEQGDHAGLAIALSNLTNIALKQHDMGAARRNMKAAFQEVESAPAIDVNNLATLYTVKGALARTDGDLREAIAADQRAIDIWTKNGGPKSKLGVAYSLRSEAYAMIGNNEQAVSDSRYALVLLEEGGRSSRIYLKAQLAYAHVLRETGAKQEGARLEKQARTALANFRTQHCDGCTISAESFR
jgi:tetratricopeptide (TPR) repeat protein